MAVSALQKILPYILDDAKIDTEEKLNDNITMAIPDVLKELGIELNSILRSQDDRIETEWDLLRCLLIADYDDLKKYEFLGAAKDVGEDVFGQLKNLYNTAKEKGLKVNLLFNHMYHALQSAFNKRHNTTSRKEINSAIGTDKTILAIRSLYSEIKQENPDLFPSEILSKIASLNSTNIDTKLLNKITTLIESVKEQEIITVKEDFYSYGDFSNKEREIILNYQFEINGKWKSLSILLMHFDFFSELEPDFKKDNNDYDSLIHNNLEGLSKREEIQRELLPAKHLLCLLHLLYEYNGANKIICLSWPTEGKKTGACELSWPSESVCTCLVDLPHTAGPRKYNSGDNYDTTYDAKEILQRGYYIKKIPSHFSGFPYCDFIKRIAHIQYRYKTKYGFHFQQVVGSVMSRDEHISMLINLLDLPNIIIKYIITGKQDKNLQYDLLYEDDEAKNIKNYLTTSQNKYTLERMGFNFFERINTQNRCRTKYYYVDNKDLGNFDILVNAIKNNAYYQSFQRRKEYLDYYGSTIKPKRKPLICDYVKLREMITIILEHGAFSALEIAISIVGLFLKPLEDELNDYKQNEDL